MYFFDQIINTVSRKYDAFTVEEREDQIIYTLVSNDRTDFESLKDSLQSQFGKQVCLKGKGLYEIQTADDMGLSKIIFQKKE